MQLKWGGGEGGAGGGGKTSKSLLCLYGVCILLLLSFFFHCIYLFIFLGGFTAKSTKWGHVEHGQFS